MPACRDEAGCVEGLEPSAPVLALACRLRESSDPPVTDLACSGLCYYYILEPVLEAILDMRGVRTSSGRPLGRYPLGGVTRSTVVACGCPDSLSRVKR